MSAGVFGCGTFQGHQVQGQQLVPVATQSVYDVVQTWLQQDETFGENDGVCKHFIVQLLFQAHCTTQFDHVVDHDDI